MSKISGIYRYLLIISRVRKGDYPSKVKIISYLNNELMLHVSVDAANVSTRTFERDLRDINIYLGISISYDTYQKGYHIPSDEGNMPSSIESILEPFYILNSLQADSGLEKVVFPEKQYPKGLEHIFTLIKAAKTHRCVEFDYVKYHEAKPFRRTINPYALKQVRGRWYLLGIDNNSCDNELRTFGLDRICNILILNTKFTPQEINISKKYEGSFGIMSYEHLPIEKVILEFDNLDGHYLKSVPLHHSQQIIKDCDNSFVLSLHIRITHDFLMELLSRSFSLKVISPPHLKSELVSILNKALERNKS